MSKLREMFRDSCKKDAEFCKRYAQQKNGLDYIPWARMHQMVMGLYDGVVVDQAVRMSGDPLTAEVEVGVVLRLGEEVQDRVFTVLAVTDFKNKPVSHPSTADVQNTRQRAYAKALSMATGIGLSLWLKGV